VVPPLESLKLSCISSARCIQNTYIFPARKQAAFFASNITFFDESSGAIGIRDMADER
jgi:hypothetical protein